MNLKSSALIVALVTATGASATLPPIPPSGPITGLADCLFENGRLQEAGQAQFNEEGLPVDGMVSIGEPLVTPQVRLTQFPIDGNVLTDIEFEAGGTIILHAEHGSRVAGKFSPLHRASGNRWWMEFAVPDPKGGLVATGKCLVDIRGRSDRPVRLDEVVTIRVD